MKVDVLVYTKKNCPYCVRAKEFFIQKNISFQEIDITGDSEKIESLKGKTGHMTLPQIFVEDKFIGGYSDLISKYDRGELKFDDGT